MTGTVDGPRTAAQRGPGLLLVTVLAVLLLAAKFGVPVCPHAGGVGLCEAVQHIAMFDFVAVSGTRDGRVIEFVDHLHEHFVAPVTVVNGRYQAPGAPGNGAEMYPESVSRWTYPSGAGWEELRSSGRITAIASD